MRDWARDFGRLRFRVRGFGQLVNAQALEFGVRSQDLRKNQSRGLQGTGACCFQDEVEGFTGTLLLLFNMKYNMPPLRLNRRAPAPMNSLPVRTNIIHIDRKELDIQARFHEL